jgi:type VI secretion system protein ImpH
MAGENRKTAHAVELSRQLQEEPHKFDFFEAVRCIEALHAEKPGLGRTQRPVDDPVRLAQEPSLAFAPSTIAAFEAGAEGRTSRMEVCFLGLLGPNGPLPLHITEYVRQRLREAHDPTIARFLDVFHHRMLSLFYRAWADGRPTVSYDRPESDRFADYIGALFGLGHPAMRHRDAMPDLAKYHYSGSLSCETRHPDGLRAMLSDFFQLEARLEEFVARWIDLPEDCLCRLGDSPDTGALGVTATVGDRVMDCTHTFRVVLGPLRFEQFRRFLPGQESLKRLAAMVWNYVGHELAWQMQLILKKEEVPPVEIGQAGQLGLTTWLATEKRERDADNLVIEPSLSI